MSRRPLVSSLLSLLCFVFFLSSAIAQVTASGPDSIGQSTTTMTMPSQLRRVAPPAASAGSADLEKTGDELRVQKFFADALDYYAAAMSKQDNAVLHNKAGIADLQMLRYSDAKKQFERAIKMEKTYPEPYNNLGVVHYILRNYRRSISAYKKALQLRDDSASFHSNLATAYFSRREYEKATQEYARAIQLDPNIFEHRSNGGVSAHLTSPEDRAHYSYVIAKMYAKAGDVEHCLLYLKKALDEGYRVAEHFGKDAEFAGFRKDPRFIAVVSRPDTLK